MRMPNPDDSSASLGEWYDEHGPALYRYALMLLTDHAGAEDAVQEVFAGLLTLRRPPTHIGAYLRAALRNACYSRLRRRRRWAERELPLLEVVDPTDSAMAERLSLEAALRTLAPEQREVVHLHVFEGFTLREVAETAKTSINTIASRYRYALAHLRTHLAAQSSPPSVRAALCKESQS